jgi:hypothetical protein
VNDLGKAIVLAAKLYGDRASVAYSGYVKRDPLALLQLSRVDPYPGCARIRAAAGLVPAPDAGRAHARPSPGGRHPQGRRLDPPRAAVPAGHRRAPAGRRAPECAGRKHHRGPLGVIGVSKRPIA